MKKPLPDVWTLPRIMRGYGLSLLAQGLADNGLTQLPLGHASPVFIATGLFGPKESTNQLLRFLRKHDFSARRLNSGLHLPSTDIELPYGDYFARGVEERHYNTGKKVHLVGWSLGGLAALLYGGRHPEHVASIHTIAAPLKNAQESSYLAYLQPFFEYIGRNPLTDEINDELAQPSIVPHYSYIAVQDEIVNPELCRSASEDNNRFYAAGHLEIGFRPDMYADLIRDISQNIDRPTQNHPLKTLENSLDSLHHFLSTNEQNAP